MQVRCPCNIKPWVFRRTGEVEQRSFHPGELKLIHGNEDAVTLYYLVRNMDQKERLKCIWLPVKQDHLLPTGVTDKSTPAVSKPARRQDHRRVYSRRMNK